MTRAEMMQSIKQKRTEYTQDYYWALDSNNFSMERYSQGFLDGMDFILKTVTEYLKTENR